VATVASAAEGYPFVPPEWMPSVLVPTVGLIVPAIAMGWVSRDGGEHGSEALQAPQAASTGTIVRPHR
jgi:hypothetical protein